jgi:signal transduction histidine kinase
MRLMACPMAWLKRRRWNMALTVCVSAALGMLMVSELGHRQLTQGYEHGIESIWRGARLNELSAKLADTETGQRSYLLTWKEEYLEPYHRALPAIRRLLDELRRHYAASSDAETERVFQALVDAIGAKLGEIELTLQLVERARADRALEVVDSGVGRQTMDEIRYLLDDLAGREDALVNTVSSGWRQSVDVSRLSLAGATALNVLLLTLLFTAMKRDWRRAQERQELLNRMVRDRTRQLDMLASRLQEASEAEKAAMARELHDELGALLTASKMDVARICQQLGTVRPDLSDRLGKVMKNLDQGLLTKRRIVEGLRPSALAYFGLGTAARELVEQIAERAGWEIEMDIPDSDPDLSSDAEIALFRVLQESLTNAAKYAAATKVRVALRCEANRCALEIADNGVGFVLGQVRVEAQGLFGMRHRIEARRGYFAVCTAPGAGTRVTVVIPDRPLPLPLRMPASAPPPEEWEIARA